MQRLPVNELLVCFNKHKCVEPLKNQFVPRLHSGADRLAAATSRREANGALPWQAFQPGISGAAQV